MARVRLTAGRIRHFACPADKAQSFLWDTDAPGLAVRATSTGVKAFIFQSKLNGRDLRVTIGDVRAWSIESSDPNQPGAREEARRLQTLIDQGIDPRQDKAERIAKIEAARQEEQRHDVTLGEAWKAYIEARRPKWSARHFADHLYIISNGRPEGEIDQAKEKTAAALAPLAPVKLSDLTSETVKAWLQKEVAKRPTQASIAFRKLRAFLNWCEDHPEYQGLANPDACGKRMSRDVIPKQKPKTDCLQREQLKPWFSAVLALSNPVIAAYLQILLLTGARREELSTLRWENVDLLWKAITLKDKVEGERTIPMTPYVAALLRSLKARNETPPPRHRILHGKRIENDLESWKPSAWVFSSPTAESGRIVEPRIAHNRALATAGLPALSLHGLRRSFGTLSEWVEVPTGVVAQIMGHKPSALAEKHYRQRPLDLLRMWHTKIEAWLLEQADIDQPPEAHAKLQIANAQG